MNFFRRHIIFITIAMSLVGILLFFMLRKNDLQHEVPAPAIPAPLTQRMNGMVTRYGSNGHGDIDKMLMKGKAGQLWIHFPPHAARFVLQATDRQVAVTIEYTADIHGKGEMNNELRTITDRRNHLVDLRSIPPPPPSRGDEVTVSGNKFYIRKDEEGRMIGFVLAGTLVVLPPHIAENLMPMILTAQELTVKGQQRSDEDGFVNVYGKVLRPSSITIDHQTYLVQ